jgi:GTPase SAR1 family protein
MLSQLPSTDYNSIGRDFTMMPSHNGIHPVQKPQYTNGNSFDHTPQGHFNPQQPQYPQPNGPAFSQKLTEPASHGSMKPYPQQSPFSGTPMQQQHQGNPLSVPQFSGHGTPQRQQQPLQVNKYLAERMLSAKTNLEKLKQHRHHDRSRVIAAFNDLQSIASQFNVTLDIPEVVVVGMQSDGKSSFIEALLGFQFNIVDTGIGTRRPLIIQMMYEPTQLTPLCKFQKDELENNMSRYQPPQQTPFFPGTSPYFPQQVQKMTKDATAVEDSTQQDDNSLFEDASVPVHALSAEITRRTNLVPNSEMVSDRPIVLRVQYNKCSNLTIYDTPGFRLGGDERLRLRIRDMVTRLITPEHRIIVCLEQSTVEWANSNSRPIVQQIDPYFERTVLVSTKFDNRLKELQDGVSADKYLAGDHHPPDLSGHNPHRAAAANGSTLSLGGNKQNGNNKSIKTSEDSLKNVPYFISMPIRRGVDPETFEQSMSECQLHDLERLHQLEFDHQRFESHIGIYQLRAHLEQLVYAEYMKKLAPTLHAMDRKLEEICKQIGDIEVEMDSLDFELQKSRVWLFMQRFSSSVEMLLGGSMDVDISTFGETLDAEIQQCGHTKSWGISISEPPLPNHLGGAYNNLRQSNNSITLDDQPEEQEYIISPYFTPGASLLLFGGSQIARLVADYERHLLMLKMPEISEHELACAAGIHFVSALAQKHRSTMSHSGGFSSDTMHNIASTKLMNMVKPMISLLSDRLRHVLNRTFDIAFAYTMDKQRKMSAPQLVPFVDRSLEIRSFDSETLGGPVAAQQLSAQQSSFGAQRSAISGPQLDITKLEHHHKLLETFRNIFGTFVNMTVHRLECVLHEDLLKLTSSSKSGLMPTRSYAHERSSSVHRSENTHHRVSDEIVSSSLPGTSQAVSPMSNGQLHFKRSTHTIAQLTLAVIDSHLMQPMMTQVLPQFMDFFTHLEPSKFESLFHEDLPKLKQQLASQSALKLELQSIRKRFMQLTEQSQMSTLTP